MFYLCKHRVQEQSKILQHRGSNTNGILHIWNIRRRTAGTSVYGKLQPFVPSVHLFFCILIYVAWCILQVTLENCPGELFINVSPTKCWSMVRERLNMEIRRQLSMGRANLPALQPPGSVDGFEMFGLLSPSIVQVRKPFTWPHSETHYISRNEKKRRNTETHQLHEKWNLFQGCITVWWFTHSSRCCHMLGLLSV